MKSSPDADRMHDPLISYFLSRDAMRSRRVSNIVLSSQIDVPVPPARLVADWNREIATRLVLEPGDVEQMPLARTRTRWREFDQCLQAMANWTRTWGLHDVLGASDISLMACRGARYHHDGDQYGGAAFCNLFLSDDKGLDVHFPGTGDRIPLTRGTVMIFDTCQPHAVIARHSDRFNEADFASGQDVTQLFLTWELPIEDTGIASALGVTFDVAPSNAPQLDEEQVWLNGSRVFVRPDSGQWQPQG